MITYRAFRNGDPPRILGLWNASGTGRAFGRANGCDVLEHYLFSKPYFDRHGLIVAEDNGELVGFSHAGFGCDDTYSRLDHSRGTLCMLLVREDRRRQGIGTELAARARDYLRAGGAQQQFAGALHPINPFYLGLYGGSEMPGILESDAAMTALIQRQGYRSIDTCVVFQRRMETAPVIDDNRIPLLRREVDVLVEPWPAPPTWWHACTIGPMISLRYEMVERRTRLPIGHAWAWEMDAFAARWRCPSVGITQFEIEPDRRRHGFASLLLHGILKHLFDQRVGIVEVQTMERNEAARGLYQKLGFAAIDKGHAYQLETA